MKSTILELARCGLELWEREGAPANRARELCPRAALAVAGDKASANMFANELQAMALAEWGLHEFALESGLNDAFCLRAIVEAYKGLLALDLIGRDVAAVVDPWLYRHAASRAEGACADIPDFEDWHLKNQNVPATLVYEIAQRMEQADHHEPTAPLYAWADSMMAGWDLSWRGPDNSWLYQFIWCWSSYRHAAIRRPELLTSDNARRSIQIYSDWAMPGGVELVFGEANPGDILGPLTAVVLGAHLFQDRVLMWLANQMLERAVAGGSKDGNFAERCVELYRLYSLWPDALPAKAPEELGSVYITSPLPGKGWSLGGTVYNETVKQQDTRFPAYGVNTYDFDDLYQVQTPSAYRQQPDKLIFRQGCEPQGLQAAVELRSHGLHEHADALGVISLFHGGVPWLVETGYVPRELNRYRWLHNVPLFRRGQLHPSELKCWRSDRWCEPLLTDVQFHQGKHVDWARAYIAHDAFDYVDFAAGLFDCERFYVFEHNAQFLVVDRLTAASSGPVTVGQIWHSSANCRALADGLELARDGLTFQVRVAQSFAASLDIGHHDPEFCDPLYFPGMVNDMLYWSNVDVVPGDVLVMVATFGPESRPVTVCQERSTQLTWGEHHVTIDAAGSISMAMDAALV